VPILKHGSVFFPFSSLYYTDIKYSSTGEPPSTPSVRARSRGLQACSGHHRLSTSPEIERSCSLLEAVGFLWASAIAISVNNPPEPLKSSMNA